LQQLEHIRASLQYLKPPRRIMCAIEGLIETSQHTDPKWYNIAANFKDATSSAIEMQSEAFAVLSSEELWNSESPLAGGGLANRMWKSAELCASSGAEVPAINLLRLESKQTPRATNIKSKGSAPLFPLVEGERPKVNLAKLALATRSNTSRQPIIRSLVTDARPEARRFNAAMRMVHAKVRDGLPEAERWRLDLALTLLEPGLQVGRHSCGTPRRRACGAMPQPIHEHP
jgi:hypothetical protein